ncbi:hypothetical protein ACFUVV_10030 [Streptomyces sp. NPDC057376]|nr:hypothetical protein [Streptomyces sp. CB02414]
MVTAALELAYRGSHETGLGRELVPEKSLEMHRRMEVFQLYRLWRHR